MFLPHQSTARSLIFDPAILSISLSMVYSDISTVRVDPVIGNEGKSVLYNDFTTT
jgi:hypothetical protein